MGKALPKGTYDEQKANMLAKKIPVLTAIPTTLFQSLCQILNSSSTHYRQFFNSIFTPQINVIQGYLYHNTICIFVKPLNFDMFVKI